MEPFIGQIMMFAGNFAPRNWAFCEGQLLPIASYQSLFSIVGTTYGGDGRTTFALPDLRGRVPINPGTGPGLSTYRVGQRGGQETHVLTTQEMPSHNHVDQLKVSSANATESSAANGSSLAAPGAQDGRTFTNTLGYNTSAPDVALNSGSIVGGLNGGSRAHNNMQPFLACYYIIALDGIYPPRS